MPTYLRYSDDLETPEPDEAETLRSIGAVMAKGQHTVRQKYGESVRISHAKAHGFLKGELEIRAGLPTELAQGLFARPGRHDVLVRVSQAPGEMLDDRKVSTPRGMAIKVFGVEGAKLAGHEGATTQDFVLDTGKVFINSTLKAFLASFTLNATVAPRLSEGVKGAVSKVAQATNAAFHAVSLDAPKADTYGHPSYHPMGEAYYSQIALRYGDYVAKLAVIPANAPLEALFEKLFAMGDENALRTATMDYFRFHPAEFDVKIQLATDPVRTPIEDPMVEWPEAETFYCTVARLRLPVQDAFDRNLQAAVDRELSFSPAHALAAHRPLGRFGRARVAVYTQLARLRREENGQPTTEPRSLAEVEQRAASAPTAPPIRVNPLRSAAHGARSPVDLAHRSNTPPGLFAFAFAKSHPLATALVASACVAGVSWLITRHSHRLVD